MPGSNYPERPMHRIAYTSLTENQIQTALNGLNGPTSASPLSDALSGQSMTIVTDEGPTLAYSFGGGGRLSVTENGGGASESGYGALQLNDHIVFFTHMIPGTQRGYNVIVDRGTGLATVFEVWFSGFDDLYREQDWFEPGQNNREVQRHVWFGYVDNGGAAPEERHERTNRVAGKGYFWRQDNGTETLEYYPSLSYTYFAELSRTGGELGFCAPADYVKIDDHTYVYSRTECEFSGVFTIYAFDVNTVEQVGARLGFDENDNLDYYVFKGEGEMTGQIARFEPFGRLTGAEMPEGKGARPVYRPLRTYAQLTEAEVDALGPDETHVFEGSGMAGNQEAPTDYLAGKTFNLRWDDGRNVEYRVDSATSLQWREDGGSWREQEYKAWQPAPGVIMFGHMMSGAEDHDAQIVVADFDHGLATLLHGAIGNPYIANEARVHRVFGVIEQEGKNAPMYRRHETTDELLGHAITWEYSPGLNSMHVYGTPHSLSWVIPGQDDAMGMEWSGPSDYVKIRDGLYLTYWLEEACNGTLGTILVNMKAMHDCGIGLHCGPNGVSLSSVGAIARHAGKFDVAKYFQIDS